MIKVYNKKELADHSLKKSAEIEILVHENLKQSRNILSMIASFESKSELFIVYQNFQGFVDMVNKTQNDFE